MENLLFLRSNFQTDSLPSKSLTHRYSLPILKPENNFGGSQTLKEDNVWDNSMYEDDTKSQKRRPLYSASKEQDHDKHIETIKANQMYKGDIKSQSTKDTYFSQDQVSDLELDSRLAHLCLSVTKNALE